MTQYMDVVGSLRKIAGELTDIGAELGGPHEIVAKIGGASFMLQWIADGLERELEMAAERGRKLQAAASENGPTKPNMDYWSKEL